MIDSFQPTDIWRLEKYFNLEWEKIKLINVEEFHNKKASCMSHCKIQLCASKEPHIVSILECIFFSQDSIEKVDGIFINFQECSYKAFVQKR